MKTGPSTGALAATLQQLPWRALTRWFLVGVAFLAVGSGILYVFKDLLAMPLAAATVVSGEITLLIRFFINDSWVFGNHRPAWRRLWQFHIAAAGGFGIWFAVTLGLARLGLHYMLANVIGSATSMCFSIATNFLWVWRKRSAEQASQATAALQ